MVTNNNTSTLNGALAELGETMAANITAKGVSASASDGLTTLAGKISQITGGGGTCPVTFENQGTEFNYTRKRSSNGFTVTIPSGTTKIGAHCFYYCQGLKDVSIPNTVTTIDSNAFYYCNGLTSITLPNSLTTIGSNAFYYCTGLTSITLPNTVTTINSNAFQYCQGLTSITIPNTVTSLGGSVFERCTGLTSVTIGTGLTTLPGYCFNYCTHLTEITIPSNITGLGNYALSNCTGLEKIRFESATPPSASSNSFNNLPTTCVIEVPCDSLSAYTSASNYPSSSTYTYVPYGCNGLKFLQDSYTTNTGTCEVSLRLWDNNAPVSGGTITITGSDSSSYTCTTDSNGEATCTLTNVSGTVTYTATYSSYSATCTVTAQTVTVYYESALTSDDGKWNKSSSSGMTVTYNSNGLTVLGTAGADRTYYINTSSVTIPTSNIIVEMDWQSYVLGAYNNSTEIVVHNAKLLMENSALQTRMMTNNNVRQTISNPTFPLHLKFEVGTSDIKIYVDGTLLDTVTTSTSYRNIGLKTYNNRSATIKNIKVYEL